MPSPTPVPSAAPAEEEPDGSGELDADGSGSGGDELDPDVPSNLVLDGTVRSADMFVHTTARADVPETSEPITEVAVDDVTAQGSTARSTAGADGRVGEAGGGPLCDPCQYEEDELASEICAFFLNTGQCATSAATCRHTCCTAAPIPCGEARGAITTEATARSSVVTTSTQPSALTASAFSTFATSATQVDLPAANPADVDTTAPFITLPVASGSSASPAVTRSTKPAVTRTEAITPDLWRGRHAGAAIDDDTAVGPTTAVGIAIMLALGALGTGIVYLYISRRAWPLRPAADFRPSRVDLAQPPHRTDRIAWRQVPIEGAAPASSGLVANDAEFSAVAEMLDFHTVTNMLAFHDGNPASLAAARVAKAPARRVAYATAPNGGGLQYVVDLQAPPPPVHLPGAMDSSQEPEADARLFEAVHGRSHSSVSRC